MAPDESLNQGFGLGARAKAWSECLARDEAWSKCLERAEDRYCLGERGLREPWRQVLKEDSRGDRREATGPEGREPWRQESDRP